MTAGSTETGRRWAVAAAAYSIDGFDIQTYLLVANPTDQDGTFIVKLTREGTPSTTCTHSADLPAHSRRTLDVPTICAGVSLSTGVNYFAGTVESSGPGIVAERVTYQSEPGVLWSAGASTALTKLPDLP